MAKRFGLIAAVAWIGGVAMGAMVVGLMACSPPDAKPAMTAASIQVEAVFVNRAGTYYYRWCDGRHLMFTTGFGTDASLVVVPNDPRCTAEAK